MEFKEFEHYKDMLGEVKKKEKVIVSVRPRECAICKMYAPHFKKAMNEVLSRRKDIEVCILWIDDECIEHLNICSPTILFYKDGKEVKRVVVEQVPLEKFEEELKRDIESIYS